MPTVKKLDSKRRVVFPDTFAPGDVFLEDCSEEGRITFSLIAPAQPPPASMETDGELLVIASPLSRDLVQKAIRTERDRE